MSNEVWIQIRLPVNQELSLGKPYARRWTVLNNAMSKVKLCMSQLGFRLNIDYKFEVTYNSSEIKLLLAPDIESYASWIVLNWDEKKCEN